MCLRATRIQKQTIRILIISIKLRLLTSIVIQPVRTENECLRLIGRHYRHRMMYTRNRISHVFKSKHANSIRNNSL